MRETACCCTELILAPNTTGKPRGGRQAEVWAEGVDDEIDNGVNEA